MSITLLLPGSCSIIFTCLTSGKFVTGARLVAKASSLVVLYRHVRRGGGGGGVVEGVGRLSNRGEWLMITQSDKSHHKNASRRSSFKPIVCNSCMRSLRTKLPMVPNSQSTLRVSKYVRRWWLILRMITKPGAYKSVRLANQLWQIVLTYNQQNVEQTAGFGF